MKFFIDTANLAQIQEAHDLGILDGVTTNPSLMAKEGIKGYDAVMQHYVNICNIVDGDVSAEVLGTTFDDIVREGEKGIKTNCTLVFSAGQAILAAKAGATYVSPFIGRIDDSGHDGLDLIEQMVQIYDNYSFQTQILAASVRNSLHIIKCAEIGADVITAPLDAIVALLNHPLTDNGLAKFLADAKKMS